VSYPPLIAADKKEIELRVLRQLESHHGPGAECVDEDCDACAESPWCVTCEEPYPCPSVRTADLIARLWTTYYIFIPGPSLGPLRRFNDAR
jgi:hypothetical protein